MRADRRDGRRAGAGHGPTKQVFADPRTVQGGRLTGCKNIFPARKVDDHTIFVPDWGVDLHPARMVEDGLVAMGVRAHSFRPEEERNPPCRPLRGQDGRAL